MYWWRALVDFAKTLLAGLCLVFLIRPKSIKALRPMPHFWLCLILQVPLGFALQKWQWLGAPQVLSNLGLLTDVFFATLVLAMATLVANLLKRAVMSYAFASLLLAASLFFALLWSAIYLGAPLLQRQMAWQVPAWVLLLIYGLHWLLLCLRTAQYCFADSKWWLRIPAVGLTSATVFFLCASGWLKLPRYVDLDRVELYSDEAELPAPKPSFDPEQVMYGQTQQLQQALDQVLPSDPNRSEIYLLALAGDSSINAFLNEAEYAKKLFENRFLARGRSLLLANHPFSTKRLPLANLTNLQMALAALGKKMGPEDALFLFMTSHGSPPPEHEFLIDLPPLALNQINPTNLRAAMTDAGIHRYFAVVSACYSGGYLDALQNPDAIVMTAARADRSSFGCAPDQDMTYFGHAYLLEALNKTKDFVKAFELAERSVEQREKREQLLPSMPQIRIGRAAREWLNDWQRGMEPGEPVPFFPAPESSASETLAPEDSAPQSSQNQQSDQMQPQAVAPSHTSGPS